MSRVAPFRDMCLARNVALPGVMPPQEGCCSGRMPWQELCLSKSYASPGLMPVQELRLQKRRQASGTQTQVVRIPAWIDTRTSGLRAIGTNEVGFTALRYLQFVIRILIVEEQGIFVNPCFFSN